PNEGGHNYLGKREEDYKLGQRGSEQAGKQEADCECRWDDENRDGPQLAANAGDRIVAVKKHARWGELCSIEIFGSAEEGKTLLGSHSPHRSLSYCCAIVFGAD